MAAAAILEKMKNRHTLAVSQPISTKLGVATHFDTFESPS